MRVQAVSPLVVLLMMMGGIWSGCDTEPESLIPNQEPNTRISAAPPEMSDTGYAVNIFWFGWDDDGFVDYYEIAWETPDEWLGPVFTNDSLFAVAAAETCCVDPLVDYPPNLPDSVYEQFHTFYVRAVDNDGVPDSKPARRSFNAKTIAPWTQLQSGPPLAGFWGSNVKFTWIGNDDDGVVEAYRYALSSVEEYVRDGYVDNGNVFEYMAWLDTLTYRPLPAGERGPNPWTYTEVDSVEFPALPEQENVIFGVRSIDNAGAEETILDISENVVVFNVVDLLSGPTITLTSNVAGSIRSGEAEEVREVFAGQGIRFDWFARPGASGVEVAGFGWAVDDTSDWSPYSLNSNEYPERQDPDVEEFWFPESGDHAFFVRAIDVGGFIQVLSLGLRVFDGPSFCDAVDRFILVVLDADPDELQQTLILPGSYQRLERGLMNFLFEGYNFVLFETDGARGPDVSVMNCASSVFWFHTASIDGGDASVLNAYHVRPPNVLSSYVGSGGNLFICGTQPGDALKFFEDPTVTVPVEQTYPVFFCDTLDDTTWVPHWAATTLRFCTIQETVPSTFRAPPSIAEKRLRAAVSEHPAYPDLRFDPLTWPSGPIERGCGLYDRGIQPRDDAEILYRANNDSGPSIAIRKNIGPGVNGNIVYLGFHPYFFQRPDIRGMIRAVLDDFGEAPI